MIEPKKPRIVIEEWAVSRRKDRFTEDLKFASILVGVALTHPKFLAMSEEERRKKYILSSSRLLYFNFEERVAETLNTIYELGSIDPFWARYLEEEGILLSSFDLDERESDGRQKGRA